MMRIGILGGGQLGRMMAIAGHPIGISVRVLEPADQCPSSAVAEHFRGEYDDFRILSQFYQGLDAVSYEFENVPIETANWLAERTNVYPPPVALLTGQNRITEKNFFRDLGIEVPNFAEINNREEFDKAIAEIGLPAVLKTTRFGYDGKGQAVLKTQKDCEEAWKLLGGRQLILEGFVRFDRELSIITVRDRGGHFAFYPLIENTHREGILRKSVVPAREINSDLQKQAESIASMAMNAMDYVGVLTVELFQVGEQLLVNEMAPRVHNSGHWTIEGSETSQFENHLRAVAGLPLGSTRMRGQSIMINLIGDWPDVAKILAIPHAHLHLYGKTPRPNRKVGHITLRADDPDRLQVAMSALRQLMVID